MCNNGADDDESDSAKYMPLLERTSVFLNKCNKCRDRTPFICLRSKDQYCKGCFLVGTVHKFKAILGKHKLIRPNDQVLILHKCGHRSTALLHFIRTGLDLDTHKKLRFQPIILFMDEVSNLSIKERQEILEKIGKEAEHFKFPVYFTSLALLLSNNAVKDCLKCEAKTLKLTDNDADVIKKVINQQKNETNEVDFLNILQRNFLTEIAKHLNCKFVFTPELSNDVASQMLTDVSLGRGNQMAINAGFCDNRDETVKVLRPLRVFDAKELVFYNYLNALEPISFRVSVENPYKSVQALMKHFLSDLQANYPATVTTILKTSDKLTVNTRNTPACKLCRAPVDESFMHLVSKEATEFSHFVSTQSSDGLMVDEKNVNTLAEFNGATCDDYCFSCKKIVKI